MYKTAATIAAYEGRNRVQPEDVREAAEMALLHRQRRQPFQQPHLETDQLDSMMDQFQDQSRHREPSDGDGQTPDDPDDADPDLPQPDDNSSGLQDQTFEVGNPFAVRPLQIKPPDHRPRPAAGRRAGTVSGSSSGRYVGAATPTGKATDLALDATLRAAAPHQASRRIGQSGVSSETFPAMLIESWDVREKVRETKTGSLILFVVDASGSMGAQRRMVAVKGAILSLLLDAYQRRDRIGLIAFRGPTADLLLPPTSSVDLAQVRLSEMPTGGRTPLGRGLLKALEVIETEKTKDPNLLLLLVLMSDGRTNVSMGSPAPEVITPMDEAKVIAATIREQRISAVVIDTETDFLRLGLATPIAEAMGAPCLRLEEIDAEAVGDAVRLHSDQGRAPPPFVFDLVYWRVSNQGPRWETPIVRLFCGAIDVPDGCGVRPAELTLRGSQGASRVPEVQKLESM